MIYVKLTSSQTITRQTAQKVLSVQAKAYWYVREREKVSDAEPALRTCALQTSAASALSTYVLTYVPIPFTLRSDLLSISILSECFFRFSLYPVPLPRFCILHAA